MPKLNKVKERLIYLSPTVQAGWEDESNITDFEVLKSLGQGAFGKVYKVCHKKSRLIYAIKEMNKSQLKSNNMVEQVANEVKIMYSLNNEYIIKLYNHFEDEKNIYLVIEFASGGQLYQNMFKQPGKRFNEKTVAKYIDQLVESLDYIHNKQIIHRDIKPENILIDGSDNIKLADFGWSNFFKPDQKRNTFCGTLDYLAPEMIEKGHKHDRGVDIWSVGVLAYELLSGCSPFSPVDLTNKDKDQIEEETKTNILNSKYVCPKDFSPMAKDFIAKVLVKNPSQRLKTPEMREHPWLTTILEREPTAGKSKFENYVKKEIEKVNLSPEEIGDKTAADSFSNEEIYQYTRPDSIINKEHDDDFKKLSNYNKNEIKMGGWESPDSDSKGQMISKLTTKIKELEARNAELEILHAKKANEKDAYSDHQDKIKKLEEDNLFYTNKVKLLEDSLAKSKAEFQSTWKSLMEKEKYSKELQNELLQKEEALVKSEKQKKKYKEEFSVLEEKMNALKAENDELRSKGDLGGGEKKGELLDQFDDYLEKLKQKHKQELNELTKK